MQLNKWPADGVRGSQSASRPRVIPFLGLQGCERGPPFSSPKFVLGGDARRGPSRTRQAHKARGLTQLQGSQPGCLSAASAEAVAGSDLKPARLEREGQSWLQDSKRRSSWFTAPLGWSLTYFYAYVLFYLIFPAAL